MDVMACQIRNNLLKRIGRYVDFSPLSAPESVIITTSAAQSLSKWQSEWIHRGPINLNTSMDK